MKKNGKVIAIIGSVLFMALLAVGAYAIININQPTAKMEPHVHDGSHSHSTTDAEEVDEVTISNYAYQPTKITVKVGTKVTWKNEDSVAHTVTTERSAPLAFDSGLFNKGESFSYTFEKPGQYDYLCTPHPYMKGSVVVTE